jgi:hypothetical protein
VIEYSNRHTLKIIEPEGIDYIEACKKSAQEHNINFIEIKDIIDSPWPIIEDSLWPKNPKVITYYFTFKD